MSSIAKIFVIVNFVLSVLFLGFAATLLSQQWDYRQMYLETKHYYTTEKADWDAKEQQSKSQIENLKSLLNDRTTVLKKSQENISDLQAKNKELEQWKAMLTQKMGDIKINLEDINSTLKDKDQQIATLTKEKEDVAKKINAAQEKAQAAYDELNRKVLELDQYKGRLAETEKMMKRARRELWEAKQIVRSVQSVGINIPALLNKVPPLEGQVVAVSPKVPIVMISVGSDEKVQKGYQFTVYRGNAYVGQVVVEEVYPDMSAARIIKDMTKRAIQRGDKVTTKIGGGGF